MNVWIRCDGCEAEKLGPFYGGLATSDLYCADCAWFQFDLSCGETWRRMAAQRPTSPFWQHYAGC